MTARYRVNLRALGCRVNEAELENWAQRFQDEGFRIVSNTEDSDLIVINTCAVTHEAVRKSRQLIRRAHRENRLAKIIVSGCYATLDPEQAHALGVDVIVSNTDKHRLVDIARHQLSLPTMPVYSSQPGENSLFSLGRQRAFVKVQDGCRHRCTFCIVTVARGAERSRPIQDIVTEIQTLSRRQIREVVLTGVHLGGYGTDLGTGLERLIAAVLADTDIARLRLGSLEPWDLPDAFFRLFENPRLMPHLHLPLQSGCDAVLRRMGRRCRTADFSRLVAAARAASPEINITTDIIVGFPGETDAEWQQSIAYIERIGFGHIHIFPYSRREGTAAARMPGQLPDEVKQHRARALHRLAIRQRRDTLLRFLGRDLPVLWETPRVRSEDGSRYSVGYTPHYLRVAAEVDPEVSLTNRITRAHITGISESGDCLLSENVTAA